ncbi:helix-turn-helix domain-containing protein [Natronoglycomyces albus]|uniref:Helix-turn-helix transcriptional regulator n=1 Tax=Natronoglycomyces albus TaxID=2811108 RepID=A0A895XNI9_9ACTN|nr:helix-turn-helix transcriptional regulator [Natronoglycomyces albus]QSB07201.1 helix-turn-helix transcriptional regulator [Natronoglycomyces albus]
MSARQINEHIGRAVRVARSRANLTLDAAGAKCGFSASVLSRLERGLQFWTVADLRIVVDRLGVPACEVGLVDEDGLGEAVTSPEKVGHDDTMRRRVLLYRSAAFLGAALIPATPVDQILHQMPKVEAPRLPNLAVRIQAAEEQLRAMHVPLLQRALAQLLPTAHAAYKSASTTTAAEAAELLARTYIVAAQVLYRSSKDASAAVAADRAVRYASEGHDPVTAAEAGRIVGIVLRRLADPTAIEVLTRTADSLIEHTGLAAPAPSATYANILCTAAYTAASQDDYNSAWEYFRVAAAAHQPAAAMSTADLAVYRISIARAAGDYGATLAHARAIDPATIPTQHAQGRYWQDIALASWNKADVPTTIHALEQLNEVASQQLLDRPWAHQLVEDILHTTTGGRSTSIRAIKSRQKVARSD